MPTNSSQFYHDRITDLYDGYYKADKDDKPSVRERNNASKDLIDAYFDKYSRNPPNAILSRLATYVLLDTLTDPHPDKMTREEYPIMSYGQTGRYFARNGKLAEDPFPHEEVIGHTPGIDSDGKSVRDAILNPETSEQRVRDWRLFLREILTQREALIIERTYEDGATQAEIAEELGVSQPRVAAIITGVYGKLSKIIGGDYYKNSD